MSRFPRVARVALRDVRRRRRSHPPCPDGHIIGPPSFVGVGAQRSGTTWWYDQLIQHPQVAHPVGHRKELHVFDSAWSRPGSSETLEYGAFFPRPVGFVIGEWTPSYMYHAWVLPILRSVAPDALIIVMLRDPIDRLRSALEYEERMGSRLTAALVQEAVSRSLYAPQLDRLRACFPEEQTLLLQYEACLADPRRELARTHQFLGIPPHEGSVSQSAPSVKVARSAIEIPGRIEHELRRMFAADLGQLEECWDLQLSLFSTWSESR